MKWLMNLLQGYALVTAQGAYPQRLLNLCAQEGVVFWGVVWGEDGQMTMTIRRSSLKKLRQLAGRLDYTLTVGDGVGLPFFLSRFRTRYAFLLGLTLSVLAVLILSNFVLTIEVTGNETLSTGEILSQLDSLGLRPGVYAPSLSRVAIAQQALLELDELSFMAINCYGTRIEVIVRERTVPPELTSTQGLASIYSDVDCIIEGVSLYRGEARVAVGDIVAKGEILISGEVELAPEEYSDLPTRWMEVYALGEVEGRTWRTLEGQIPLTTTTKVYTGEKSSTYSMTILGHCVKFFKTSSISSDKCDKIVANYQLTLPGGLTLPIYWTVEHQLGYETQLSTVNSDAAQALVEEALLLRLEGLLDEGDTLLDYSYQAVQLGDSIQVTLNAQCRETIGETIEVSPQQADPNL